MLWTLRATLLILCLSICAQAQTRTLGLYTDPPHDLDSQSNAVMHEELQRLLAPAGLEIVWKQLKIGSRVRISISSPLHHLRALAPRTIGYLRSPRR